MVARSQTHRVMCGQETNKLSYLPLRQHAPLNTIFLDPSQ